MGNIPDFVLQIQEVERNLKATWQVVQEDWRDKSSENFGNWIMVPYTKNFSQYITGDGISGLGVDDLMKQMDKHLSDMERLSGVSQDVQFCFVAGKQHDGKLINIHGGVVDAEDNSRVNDRGGVVHDHNRDRDYWDSNSDGAKPGELDNNDILKIYKDK